ncbi:putative protein (DUF3310 domain) [Campylobacter iguaniorum]|uniref:DUF3310 domain-containing protein n=1 Tax=Campylobacter iguaniorum TaxID=1244531 RepID=UPI00073A2FAC|nr:DUF3310 domain-containing protein [Campylobacter iguaniorum]ALV24956.1 putative protein (DUF3310 domain) [Campylobacter iguaniorum]
MGEFLRDERQKELLKEIKKSCFDTQIGGEHYKKMAIQPLEFITANHLDFCQGNIIKYVCRYKDKNGLEDLQKAKHYLEVLIENFKG